jgi:purine-nucleoside phosphorylase
MGADHRREHDLVVAAAERLRREGFGGEAAVVQTGSGIPAPALDEQRTVPWEAIDGLPRATAPGHRGAFHRGLCRGRPVLVLEGRLHLYEGHEPAHVVRPIRTAWALGVRRAILTSATGGVREGLRAGDVVRIVDHVNLLGADPLTGVHDPRFGERFPVVAGRAYDAALGALADAAARDLSIPLPHGVYGALHGPSFESPAEVRRLRAMGVDVCGMSVVPEVLAAAQLGVAVVAFALVANPAGEVAAGASAEKEVLDVGRRLGERVTRLVEEVVARLPQGPA